MACSPCYHEFLRVSMMDREAKHATDAWKVRARGRINRPMIFQGYSEVEVLEI